MSSLDFSIVSNNNDTIQLNVLDANGQPVILTGTTPKWQMFDPTTGLPVVTKLSSQIAIVNSSLGVANALAIAILPVDTIGLAQGYYPHEAVKTSSAGSAVTITDNDPILSYGIGFIRKQLTGQ